MGHLHHFGTPVEGEPHARQCNTCGERQRYQPPTGTGFKFTDVLVDEDDLRAVIKCAHAPTTSGQLGLDEIVYRVERLLTPLDD